MKSLRRLLTRLINFTSNRAHDARLREEIGQHIALQTAENLRAGRPLSKPAARPS
jgi:hypothetical protein